MDDNASVAPDDEPRASGDGKESSISLKDAFDIYQHQSEGVHKLWTYFQVVSIAVLGYTLEADKSNWLSETYLALGGSYFAFALANSWVVIASQRELHSFAHAVALVAKNEGEVGQLLRVKPVPVGYVGAFHALVVSCVLIALAASWHE